jgi:hypothetical protein
MPRQAGPVYALGLEHFLALLGCHHVDTTRYSGHLLAPTIRHCGFAAACSDMVSARSNVFPHFWQRYWYVGMTQDLILGAFANNVSHHLAEDHFHFVERKGAQRLGAKIAARGDTQRKRGRGLVIRRLANRDDVALT